MPSKASTSKPMTFNPFAVTVPSKSTMQLKNPQWSMKSKPIILVKSNQKKDDTIGKLNKLGKKSMTKKGGKKHTKKKRTMKKKSLKKHTKKYTKKYTKKH